MGLAAILLLLMLMRTTDAAAPVARTPARRGPARRRQPRPPIVVYPTPPTATPPAATAPPKAAPPPAATSPATSIKTPPWPSVVPRGLPPFPGAGWTPDNPPSPAVVQRAWSLLGPLWAKRGGQPGATQTEQTAGRWITYQAAAMGGGKKGVVAFKLRNPDAAATAANPTSALA